MEINTHPPKKNEYLSAEEMISRMKIVFANAKLPDFLPQFKTLGYTEEKFNGYLSKVAELEQLHQNKKKEYADQYAETEKFNKKRAEIDKIYKRHGAFCKILFKGDTKAVSVLGLNEGHKNAYASWFQQVSNFYGQLLGHAEYLEKVGTINIKQTDLEAQRNALDELSRIKEIQKKEMGEAQRATEVRDEALDKIYPIYSELTAYAKVLFEDDQMLEALGIVVKR